MRKTKVSSEISMTDLNIDQYCKSVAELLKHINEKTGSRPHSITPEEPQIMDFSDELFQY